MKSQVWGSLLLLLLGMVFLPGQAQASNLTINFDDLGLNEVCNFTIYGGNSTICPPPTSSPLVVVSTQYQASDGVTFSDCLTSAEVGGACPTFPGGNPYVVMVESNTGFAANPPTTDGQTLPNVIGLGLVTSDPNGNSPPTSATVVMNNGGTSSGVSLILTFTNAASNLTFDAYDNNTTPLGQQFAQANITYNNGANTATVNLLTTTGCGPTGGGPCPGNPNFNGLFPDPQDLSAFPNITRLEILNDTDANGTAFDNFAFSTTESQAAPEPSPLMLMGFGGLLLVVRRVIARKH